MRLPPTVRRVQSGLAFLRVIAADKTCVGWLFVRRNLVDGDEKDGVSRVNTVVGESLSEMAEFIGGRAKPYVFGCWVHDEIMVFHGHAGVGMCDGCCIRGCWWVWV